MRMKSAKKETRRYGQWAGDPSGSAENQKNCIEEVWRDWHSHQCTRARGHGKDGLYCKQHAKRHPAEEK